MLEVQRFIRQHGLQTLKDRKGIVAKEYPTGLVVLNYHQIDSPRFDPVADECRGLILDSLNDWAIVACSFKRFYNWEEYGGSRKHDMKQYPVNQAVATEKLDGSLCTVYWHGGAWHVATRGTAYAESTTQDGAHVYSELFESVLPLSSFNGLNTNCCFVFELVSPFNRIVTPYKETQLYLLTMTQCDQCDEFPDYFMDEYAGTLNVKRPRYFKFDSWDSIVAAARALDQFDEGYVCHWGDHHRFRVKLKNPAYVALHHMRGSLTERNLVKTVLRGETAEVIAYFPEFKPELDRWSAALQRVLDTAQHDFDAAGGTRQDRKYFAQKVKANPLSALLFGMYDGRPALDTLRHMVGDNAQELIARYIPIEEAL